MRHPFIAYRLLIVTAALTPACVAGHTPPPAVGSLPAPATVPAAPPAQVTSSFNRSVQASPSAVPRGADPSAALDGSLGAAIYLERALDALRDEQPAYATAALRAALATGDLNDAGRALTYWYLYVAEETQGNRRASHDALNDFVVVAETVLALRDSVRFAQSGGSDFVERFDLAGRLARGRALLNLAWAEAHQQFGRSAQEPVPVQSEAEVAYFLELSPACPKPLERRVVQSHYLNGAQASVQQVDFRCRSESAWTTYYFERRTEAARSAAVADR